MRRPRQEVAGRFARGIRAVGLDRGFFRELDLRVLQWERAVYLIRADVDEADGSPCVLAGMTPRIQHCLRPRDIGGDERLGVQNGAVDMAFRRHMNNSIAFARQLTDQFTIPDVPANKAIALVAFEVRKVLGVAGVGQGVQIDEGMLRMLAQHVAHEVGPDEAAAAGEKDFHGELD